MTVVGAFLTTSVSKFYIDTFYQQMNDVFGADNSSVVSDLRNAAEEDNAVERISDIPVSYTHLATGSTGPL